MSRASFTEDSLVQQTTAEYLEEKLGWDSIYAYNAEGFGPEGTLGRKNDREVVLTRDLRAKLVEFNPSLPDSAYDEAVRQIVEEGVSQKLAAANREKYELLLNGVLVSYRNAQGEQEKKRLAVFDFRVPGNNRFLCVRELWIRGDLYRKRADIVGFVNGIPLLFMELKNVSKDIRRAFDQNICDYKDTIPHAFRHNAFIVLGNGIDALVGTVTAKFEYFQEWKRLAENERGVVDMETLLKGVCDKRNFMDLFENFILFDDSHGEPVKIIARNHQFLGVNRAVDAVRNREALAGRLGVFWHTQGSGKSYSIVLFTRKIRRVLGGNFTFLILTDRDDLDTQIYKTFAGCGIVNNDRDRCRASDGRDLNRLVAENKAYVFSLIQKFNIEVEPEQPYTDRNDVIVITDEAHRTQYGTLALNMRNALPNASFIGFTGTPLFKDDEITRRVFGEYVSTYDFQRAVDDHATVPLYYDARGEKLGIAMNDLNERIAEKLEDIELGSVDEQLRLEADLARDYHVITAKKRLEQVAKDFVVHYSTSWESGKAMIVCIDKVTCVRMYDLIKLEWEKRIAALEKEAHGTRDDQDELALRRQLDWMRETRFAVVVSEEQGEVEKFRQWNIDITGHRRLMKDGIDIPEALRTRPEYRNRQHLDLDDAFKESAHPFRVAIVCAMWLTGFDVPCLSTLYLDKPLKAHTLMQAIARANRTAEGKTNGLIVDYCGIIKYLEKALADFAGTGDTGREPGTGPVNPAGTNEDLLATLIESIELVRGFLDGQHVALDDLLEKTSFARNDAINRAKEAANQNDETRKRFESYCREVFRRFKSCITIPGVNEYRTAKDAISTVYASLQKDREHTDISAIIMEFQALVDAAIVTTGGEIGEPHTVFDISRIDFERLRREFEKNPAKRTTVQNLKHAVEARLQIMLERNPLRTNLQRRYEDIVAEYNSEKDRATIERIFEELIRFVHDLDEEGSRAAREGLDEESLAVFDLLKKSDLSKPDIDRIKKVAKELLGKLKAEKLMNEHWEESEQTRDAVKVTIRDFLYADQTGLPSAYTEDEVRDKTDEVYRHVYRVYPRVPSPFYDDAA
jgi:type I restriction enzyme, R subunit